MPLKLLPPHKRKGPNWTIRGTYLGIYVERSAKTNRRDVAAKLRREIESDIESGRFEKRPDAPTFLSAALAYLKSGGRKRYVARLIEYFGETPLADIDQSAIDVAALEICPNTTPGSRNAAVYTPISAIRHRAGDMRPVKRPKGAKGRVVTDHLNPADALPLLECAYEIDKRFGLLLKFLLSTGCRLGEALAIDIKTHLRISERRAYVSRSKNDEPREIVLREDIAIELEAQVSDRSSGRLFPFHQGGHLKHLLMRAKLKSLGLPCPKRRPTGWRQPSNRLAFLNFHTCCHTWATWMRRYGGLDLLGLVGTGRWKDPRSAARYAHVVARDEWQRVEQLPFGGESGKKARDAS